ncbi:sugar transferase [Eggerthella lenta]|jgi:lipopolysaccharide/colanic/teichoic acid biosynthesis glycosyltransferase|uniref:Undecaprenyl-phosphate galactose phosphotransferase n=1 Tax=Eggerthella lenta (strain ATCC 25559 / DSM 2243 / CCUG 17323 / JCM 9979 / KCTC 3265 / NCTC 11813 / VPI 0255 / 1899 B) TaxID=479437 RepID=C8WM62_EGGLE|nr:MULTISPECIES: sugar transferase [Eggerthella]ACV54616.1 Undecaprenyl-phosphate galactose phosphotransferase [Eggerthella lenta DSM 2243]MDU5981459.1 sugar transferase [Eggerthella sp.]MDU6386397.1 sugar transferase [Eggerthella sp.]RDB71357.1 sugar transferase [Eggerthella lenta]RDB84291.1 sugar transferase [Eggerthella lenta]
MAASDVAFLAPELVSEAEDPVPVPAPAEGRLGYRFVKRVFDIAFSLCATIVGLIPIALLCVAIGLESPGSPIYLQKRVGYQGRPLRIFKLRTMVADSDDVEKHLDPKQLERWRRERKVDDDPRVTKVGRFLRRTSLDELPQFLNVLAGQMSVVGPRPIVEEELAAYGDAAGELLSVKPGITGWWQVQARNDATYGDGSRQELELYYVRNASLAIDAKVFLRTFSIMFGKGRTGR